MYTPSIDEFPEFSLERLLSTCFANPKNLEQKICILIDLPDLTLMHGHKFLESDGFSVQKYAHNVFLNELKDGVSNNLSFTGNSFFAFKTTGGSNLDPEDEATNFNGDILSLEKDIYPNFDIILAITDYFIDRPFNRFCKNSWFQGCNIAWCK